MQKSVIWEIDHEGFVRNACLRQTSPLKAAETRLAP